MYTASTSLSYYHHLLLLRTPTTAIPKRPPNARLCGTYAYVHQWRDHVAWHRLSDHHQPTLETVAAVEHYGNTEMGWNVTRWSVAPYDIYIRTHPNIHTCARKTVYGAPLVVGTADNKRDSGASNCFAAACCVKYYNHRLETTDLPQEKQGRVFVPTPPALFQSGHNQLPAKGQLILSLWARHSFSRKEWAMYGHRNGFVSVNFERLYTSEYGV